MAGCGAAGGRTPPVSECRASIEQRCGGRRRIHSRAFSVPAATLASPSRRLAALARRSLARSPDFLLPRDPPRRHPRPTLPPPRLLPSPSQSFAPPLCCSAAVPPLPRRLAPSCPRSCRYRAALAPRRRPPLSRSARRPMSSLPSYRAAPPLHTHLNFCSTGFALRSEPSRRCVPQRPRWARNRPASAPQQPR